MNDRTGLFHRATSWMGDIQYSSRDMYIFLLNSADLGRKIAEKRPKSRRRRGDEFCLVSDGICSETADYQSSADLRDLFMHSVDWRVYMTS